MTQNIDCDSVATLEEQSQRPAFQMEPIGNIYPSKTNPRRHFDQAKLAELAKSVAKKHGIIEPLLVRPNGVPGKFELVAGERRFRAANLAKLTEVPVIVKELNDQEALELQLIENIQREDMNEIEEGLGFAALLKLRDGEGKPVHTVQTIAERINKPVAHIYARLKVSEVTKPVEKAFYDNKISAGHAILLARLQPADQQEALEQCVRSDMSVKRLGEWIQHSIHLDLARAPFDPASKFLLEYAGSCVDCPKRSGSQPELFADIKAKDTCTDRNCYQAKTAAFVNLRVQELTAKKEMKVVRISESQSNQYRLVKQAGVLYADHYRKTYGKKCPSVALGVFVDGQKPGTVLDVCIAAKCSVHNPNSVYRTEASPAEKAKRAAEILKQRQEGLIKKRTYAAIIEKVKAPFSRVDMVAIARAIVNEMHQETRKELCALFDIEPRKRNGQHTDVWAPTLEWLDQADDYQVAKLLIGATLVTSNEFLYEPKELKSTVTDACRRYRVDQEAIRREVISETTKPKEKVQTSAKLSKAAVVRKRIAEAQKKRWAEYRRTVSATGAHAVDSAPEVSPVFTPPGRAGMIRKQQAKAAGRHA